jgi:hypothetical protein
LLVGLGKACAWTSAAPVTIDHNTNAVEKVS